jgi:hypothetical protein
VGYYIDDTGIGTNRAGFSITSSKVKAKECKTNTIFESHAEELGGETIEVFSEDGQVQGIRFWAGYNTCSELGCITFRVGYQFIDQNNDNNYLKLCTNTENNPCGIQSCLNSVQYVMALAGYLQGLKGNEPTYHLEFDGTNWTIDAEESDGNPCLTPIPDEFDGIYVPYGITIGNDKVSIAGLGRFDFINHCVDTSDTIPVLGSGEFLFPNNSGGVAYFYPIGMEGVVSDDDILFLCQRPNEWYADITIRTGDGRVRVTLDNQNVFESNNPLWFMPCGTSASTQVLSSPILSGKEEKKYSKMQRVGDEEENEGDACKWSYDTGEKGCGTCTKNLIRCDNPECPQYGHIWKPRLCGENKCIFFQKK